MLREVDLQLMDKQYIDQEIAKALYIGMIHDTGIFQYSNTSPNTLRTAAELIEYKFDFSGLIDETFYEKTYTQNQLLGRALLESIMFMDGKCIVSAIDKKSPPSISFLVSSFHHTPSSELQSV